MSQPERVVYTIGHSTHPIEVFIAMLRSFDIRLLVDIRGLPGSNKYPQYNQEALQVSLAANGIAYLHLPDLGGRRRVHRDSHNTRWRNASFRAYADYMETDDFARGITRLMDEAERQPTAYFCAEAVWWRCHRSLVSDYLKAHGWRVMHITGVGRAEEHPYTQAARVVGNRVYYSDPGLFD